MAVQAETKSSHPADHLAKPNLKEEHLLLDPKPRGEMNRMVMEAMHTTHWRFWVALVDPRCHRSSLSCRRMGIYMIKEGLGVAGTNRPVFWGIFLVNTVFWIGISHAGTFVSALLRVFKAEYRRPFTRAAELMTSFGLVQAGLSILMHMGRVWRFYWMVPYPNERMLWPNFRSPLMWDLLAITTYLLASTMYLFLPLDPRPGHGPRSINRVAAKTLPRPGPRFPRYRIRMVSPPQRSEHLRLCHPAGDVLRAHHRLLGLCRRHHDPAGTRRSLAPTSSIGALHSGIAAVSMVLIVVRSTMKNMKYFIRKEHFNSLGILMLIVSMGWAYFFFNDFMVQWYGGDEWTHFLLHWHEAGAVGWMWFAMLIFNIAVPWLILWNKKWRTTPWILFLVSLLINIGMYFERYIIVPVSLTINRSPFTWGVYKPGIEVYLTIGTFALFILLYMLASKFIPLVPVWEVQEGQMSHSIRKIGKAEIPSVADLE